MNVIGYSNYKTNIPHNLLLADTQVLTLCKNFANNLSANIKLSKTPLSKMVELRRFIEPFKHVTEPLVRVGEFVKKA